ncbi:MAG: ABC transporter permease [Solirubrobacteraceae bacterium]
MRAQRAVWEVARRELVERSRSRVMRISVVVLLILSVGGAIAAARLSGRTPTDNIALVGTRSVALEPAIRLQANAAGRRVRLHRLVTPAAGVRAVRDGSVAVALVDGSRLLVKSNRSQQAVRIVEDAAAGQGVIDRLRRSGLSQTQALGLLTPRVLPVDVLDPGARTRERNVGLLAVGLVALLMVLVFYGQAVAQGVTEEKSSRVVELLLTTVSPRRLLAGKVLGIGLLGLAQLLLLGGAALIAGQLAGGVGLPSAAPETVALVVLWFVLGYVFYSVVFAAAGALVSRQEDLQTAMTPINFLLLAAFYVAQIVANSNPNGTVARIAAFVPPLAPMVVPARMVLGDMSVVELLAAVAIDLLATAGLILLAARVYERAILRVGAPVKLRRLLASRAERTTPGTAHPQGTQTMDRTGPHNRMNSDETRQSGLADTVLRVIAVLMLLAGVAIGLSEPPGIALMAAGLLLVILLETRKHHPRRRAH